MQRNTQFGAKPCRVTTLFSGKNHARKDLARYYPAVYNFAFQLTDDSESSLVNVTTCFLASENKCGVDATRSGGL